MYALARPPSSLDPSVCMYPLDMYISKILIIFLSPGGEVFQNSGEIVEFLKKKFGENNAPQYHIVEIEEAALNEERERDLRRVYKTIHGSSEFHIMIFTPNSKSFRASPRLCLCDQCKVDYGSCSFFNSYELQVQELNQISLRSNIPPPPPPEIVGQEAVNEFITVGSCCTSVVKRYHLVH